MNCNFAGIGLKEIRLNKEAVRDWVVYPIEMKTAFINAYVYTLLPE